VPWKCTLCRPSVDDEQLTLERGIRDGRPRSGTLGIARAVPCTFCNIDLQRLSGTGAPATPTLYSSGDRNIRLSVIDPPPLHPYTATRDRSRTAATRECPEGGRLFLRREHATAP